MKRLWLIMLIILLAAPIYIVAEELNFEGEWQIYVVPRDDYEFRRLAIKDEFNSEIRTKTEYESQLDYLEERYSSCIIEITDNMIRTDYSIYSSKQDGRAIIKDYSIISGMMVTDFFHEAYGNEVAKGNKIVGAQIKQVSDNVLLMELLLETAVDYYGNYIWCCFRYPGDKGTGIKGKWMFSVPESLNACSLDRDGTGKSYYDNEMTYYYDEEENMFKICYPREEPRFGEVINPNLIQFKTCEYGKVFSYYLIKTSE